MIPDHDDLERRPAITKADVRTARAVLGAVRKLHRRHPGLHVCATYTDPLFIVIRAVDPDGATVDETWLAK